MSIPQVQSVLEVTNEVNAIIEPTEPSIADQPEIETAARSECINHPLSVADPEHITLNVSTESQGNELSQVVQTNSALNNKKCRRVVFPADDRVVLGYMHPKPPWNEASSCSTDELLTAYRSSCEKHSVRPLTKLMQQLVSIEDFSVRNESLVLRGELLDSRQVETLEEVFRRVQYKTIDAEATRLDEEGAVALFEMIEFYESCYKLNISFNKNMGNRGWQACSRMIKKTPGLEHLEARGCTFPEQMMPCFGRALRMGSTLTSLHLENTSLSGRSLLILVAAIKMNEVLQELYLADNKLMPSDGIQLGNMLKYNHNLQLLDVRNNHLQDVGTSHVCDGLWEQNLNRGLNTLVLWNNQITYQSMPSVARALMNTKCLETLNLGHNNLTTEGIHRLKDGLLQNKSLKRIGLQAARISCEGAVALAEFIAESPRLMRLDLRENDIKTAGLMALSLSLKVSQSVTRIDLDKEPKRENSMRDYAEQQRRLLNDISNYMLRNREVLKQREIEEEENRLREEAIQLVEAVKREEEERLRQEALTAVAAAQDNQQTGQISDVELENASPHVDAQKASEDDVTHSSKESSSRNLSLELKQPLSSTPSSGSQTLESPMFVPESQMPVSKPSADFTLPVIGEDGESLLALGAQSVPREFPPSPMVSAQGHPFLAPVIQEQTVVTSPDDTPPFPHPSDNLTKAPHPQLGLLSVPAKPNAPPLSPNSRRKFLVSKVEEPASVKSSECGDMVLISSGKNNLSKDTDDYVANDIAKSDALSSKNGDHSKLLSKPDLKNLCETSVESKDNLQNDSKASEEVVPSVEVEQPLSSDPSCEHIPSDSVKLNENDSIMNLTSQNSSVSQSDVKGASSEESLCLHTHSKDEGLLKTNLGLNGMREELASALDDLAIKSVPEKEVPESVSPDDFEKELDDLIANIKGGVTTEAS